ncbi:MAG TPA: sulfotransferase [Acidimicrobiales bacterium]|nr:sulfotransferase [Acidimicrobiales bacterium]
MTWTAPPRPAAAQALHEAAEAERRANPEAFSLDPDVIVQRAMSHRVADPSELVGDWRPGLEHFLGSAREDGRLNAIGERIMGEQAASKLAFGARVRATLAEHPERAGRVLQPPIVIVGGWRTGTTFLFRLLGTDPRLRAPLPLELTRPWKVAVSSLRERAALTDQLDAAPNPLHLLNPALRSVHDHGPRLAEECVLAMGVDLRSWGFPATVRLDAYASWLATQDLATAYAEYRRVLQLLDDGDGRRFVLKAPAHTPELAHVARTFPGAVVVHLHRDMVETVASGASLFAVFRSTYSDEVDPTDVGRFQLDQTELWLRRAWAFRAGELASHVTLVDVAYSDLVRDPAAVVSAVYAAAGIEPPADLPGFVEAYQRQHPRHEHGAHRYTPEDFGIDPGEVAERFAFLAVDI